jgi:hypothetical protein
VYAAVHRHCEVQRYLGFDVTAALRSTPSTGSATATEDGAEEVGESGTSEALVAARLLSTLPGHEVVEVERAVLLPSAAPERARAEERAHLVVLLPLALIGEHVVGLGDGLESLLRVRVSGVVVRMQLTSELAVRPLDLLLGGGLLDAEDGVEVFSSQSLELKSPPPSARRVSSPGPAACTAGRTDVADVVLSSLSFRVCHGDERRTQQTIPEQVAPTHHRHAGGFGDLGRGLVSDCVVPGRIEDVTDVTESAESELRQGRVELLRHDRERTDEVAVFTGAIEVVEDRQQGTDDQSRGLLQNRASVALDSLAVVGVFRADALQVTDSFVQFGP